MEKRRHCSDAAWRLGEAARPAHFPPHAEEGLQAPPRHLISRPRRPITHRSTVGAAPGPAALSKPARSPAQLPAGCADRRMKLATVSRPVAVRRGEHARRRSFKPGPRTLPPLTPWPLPCCSRAHRPEPWQEGGGRAGRGEQGAHRRSRGGWRRRSSRRQLPRPGADSQAPKLAVPHPSTSLTPTA